ncbi:MULTISPECIES: cupin domain-containing protein [unclassified Streptomyces]|jgi:quercetin dioxygenase-like cupin family protein|uniref:cupin domain-containing protein n=1 Tax=unclassified Streptomyces TaxID=2593676 RepID=UPI0029B687C6|nr:cupin domain-containing protein [Streptomyces sp. ME18-1-4]MDX3242870.1 cupin domain-containing protein [Streptomyces sp. ME18-1-4]
MSLFVPEFDETVIVRDAEAEVLGGAPVGVKLLADSSASGGALSTVRVTLGEGADGARPHLHRNSAEMFFLLDGEAEVLSGDDVVTAERGDLVIVPPNRPHAFAAAPGSTADLLIVIAPGVERFDYFRHLQRIRLGEATPESLLEVQELYDNQFLRSDAWEGRRS